MPKDKVKLVSSIFHGIMAVVDIPFKAIQRRIGINKMAYLFLLPNLVIFGLFSFWPMILNVYISFTSGASTTLAARPWVGLDNYHRLLDCPSYWVAKTCSAAGYSFWTGIWNTLAFALIQVPLMVVVALTTAVVLNREIRARGFWRAMYFYPVMLSPVVVGIIWTWILKRKGILNTLLTEITEFRNMLVQGPGFGWLLLVLSVLIILMLLPKFWRSNQPLIRYGGMVVCFGLFCVLGFLDWSSVFEPSQYRPINWLVDRRTNWPFFWVVFVYSWAHFGFYMLILLAGLQAIPPDIYEAAKMDGTPAWRIFSRITLPLLTPTMLVVLILSLIKAFQVFDEVWVLTGGGPGQATKMVIQHIYEIAFTGVNKEYGVAAASSILMAGIILVFTLIQLWLARRKADG